MRDKQWVALLDELPTDEESLEDFSRRRFPPRHPFSYQHYTFDVLDGDAWYRIDAKVPESEFYEGVPQSVQRRARAAIKAVIDAAIDAANGLGGAPRTILHDVDHTEEYEAILRAEFDDVRFVETDYEHASFGDAQYRRIHSPAHHAPHKGRFS